MRLRSITSVKNLSGKRVLVRVDLNVPIVNGKALDGDSGRIAQACEGIKWLMKRKARVILIAHLGRPKNARDAACRLAPVAARLSKRLHTKVLYDGSLVGPKAVALLDNLWPGGVALLENVRFDKGEEKNDLAFAKKLAALGELYVNDAFGVSHRKHASVAAIQTLLPSYAGPLLVREVTTLQNAIAKPKKPFLLLLGGAKMETKIGLIERLGPKATTISLGGAMANTFLAATGLPMGTSLYEKDQVETAKRIMKRFGKKMLLPLDFHLNHDAIEDVGPATVAQTIEAIKTAKLIVWNGPFGKCEEKRFCLATTSIARAVAASKATTIVGGGDTEPLMDQLGLARRLTLLSTGGGAMLAFLAGESLPGIEPLIVR